MKLEHGAFSQAAHDALTPGQVREWTGDEMYGSSRVPDGFVRSHNCPCCERCWVTRSDYRQPTRAPAVQSQFPPGALVCAFCGRPTWAGIFVRVDPAEVPYPHLETRQ